VLLYFRQSQNITREKLPKRLLYEKGAHKTLMKLTPNVDCIDHNLLFLLPEPPTSFAIIQNKNIIATGGNITVVDGQVIFY